MYNIFLMKITANENFDSVLNNVVSDLKIKVNYNDEQKELRICDIKFDKHDTDLDKDIYKILVRSIPHVAVDPVAGIKNTHAITINSDADLQFVEIADLQVRGTNIDIICVNTLIASREELSYIQNVIDFITNKLNSLDYIVDVTKFTNYEDEFYKDKEGQWHSTQYSYFIKSIVEDARATLLAKIMQYFRSLTTINTFTEAHYLEETVSKYISDELDSKGFDIKFKSFIHQAFSMKDKLNDISKQVLSEIEPNISLYDDVYKETLADKDFDSLKFIDAIKNITRDFFNKFFDKITNEYNLYPKSSITKYNKFLALAGIPKDEAIDFIQTEQAKNLVGKFPKINQEVDTAVEDIENTERDEISKKDEKGNTIGDLINSKPKLDDEEALKQVDDYIINNYDYDPNSKVYISLENKSYKPEDVIADANAKLGTNVSLDSYLKYDPEEEPSKPINDNDDNTYSQALSSKSEYESFKNKAKNINQALLTLKNDLDDILASEDDTKGHYLAIGEKLKSYKNLPQDIYNSLNNSLFAVNDISSNIEIFESVLLFNIQMTTVFMENLDYKSAVSRIKAIMNSNSRLLKYFEFKHNKVVDLEKTKDVKSGDTILDRSTGIYKSRIRTLLKSESSDLQMPVARLEQLLTQLQQTIKTL